MSEVGTLGELGIKVGDVVEWLDLEVSCQLRVDAIVKNEWYEGFWYDLSSDGYGSGYFDTQTFRVIHRANREPREWRHMTDAEKGALLLAHHEGKVIEYSAYGCGWHPEEEPKWHCNLHYRIQPESKVETVTLDTFQHNLQWFVKPSDGRASHRITFNTIDGNPDCASVKMEEIQ